MLEKSLNALLAGSQEEEVLRHPPALAVWGLLSSDDHTQTA